MTDEDTVERVARAIFVSDHNARSMWDEAVYDEEGLHA